ncbi:MAG: alpha-glucosidase [Bacteroidetes bacterium]|nr:MAG: alpha-glucosidase [Bacteroidota bacterium]
MPLRKFISPLVFLLFIYNCHAQSKNDFALQMGKLSCRFSLNQDGRPQYEVSFNQKPVILKSGLGFSLADDSLFYRAFQVQGVEKRSFDETWQPVWGETKNIRNHYDELVVHLRQQNPPGRLLNIAFRIFEDGVAFRYEFPRQPGLTYFIVTQERTDFHLAGDHKTFWIPGDFDSNEYPYTTSKISEVDNTELVKKSTEIAVRYAPDPYGVQTPLMMKTAEGLYINIHEAGLMNYSAMQLHVDRPSLTLSSSLVPDAVGNKAYVRAPFHTPWRTIIVTDNAAGILSSHMILNLNEPSEIKNTDWIHPMKFVGVWWEMQTGRSTWSFSDFADSVDANGKLIPHGRHAATTANVKKYIDFAAKNGIQGVLVEGWNTGWEDWFGNWKENVFDFVTPYPDFDIVDIMNYAKAKGVKMIMHNETSGSATNYERRMDTAFRFMTQFGYNSVKTGYVGRIIPRGEHHDGQWMVQHYLRVAEKAAFYHVMLDAHEPMRPTGVHRTYPNWIACEAARGNEFNAFSIGNPPEHETILPFTRLMGGPMDYTPGIFKIRNFRPEPDRQVHTTLTKQLALYVTMYSPLQMAADIPENYEAHMDAFQFIKDVPVDWDDTKILEAEPGDYVTLARKEKGSDNWYIGTITDENKRVANISFSFLDKGKKYTATIYADAPDADWRNNPEAYTIKKIAIDSKSTLALPIAPGGGAAISIKLAVN